MLEMLNKATGDIKFANALIARLKEDPPDAGFILGLVELIKGRNQEILIVDVDSSDRFYKIGIRIVDFWERKIIDLLTSLLTALLLNNQGDRKIRRIYRKLVRAQKRKDRVESFLNRYREEKLCSNFLKWYQEERQKGQEGKKIAVVYGAAHFRFLSFIGTLIDNTSCLNDDIVSGDEELQQILLPFDTKEETFKEAERRLYINLYHKVDVDGRPSVDSVKQALTRANELSDSNSNFMVEIFKLLIKNLFQSITKA